jgi:predicted P-loop ATPase
MTQKEKAETPKTDSGPGKNKDSDQDTKKISLAQNNFTLAEDYISKRYDIRYNEVACTFEYSEKGKNTYKPLNENSLYRELKRTGHKISLSDLITLIKSDFVDSYDPINEYFQKLSKWDGKDHIAKLASFVEAKEQVEFNKHLKKHLVRIVACAIDPNIVNKQAFILVHNKQNSGKSTFCRYLCPPGLNEYIAEDITTDKDSRILLAKNFLINLDELTVMSRKDINSLKALLSKTQINERLPYDKKNTILPRRCSFVGSTNQTEFLNDETGTVRWLCFEIKSINWNYSKEVDMDKVYAQAYHLYNKSDYQYELTKEEVITNEERNKRFHILTIERELLEKYFEPGERGKQKHFKTATDIMQRLNEFTDKEFRLNKIQIGKALKSLNYPEGRDNKYRYGYYAKELFEL